MFGGEDNAGPLKNNSTVKITNSSEKWMVINYYKSLKSKTGCIQYYDEVQATSNALGVDIDCVSEIISEYKRTKTVVSPDRMISRSVHFDQIDCFESTIIREMVYKLWSDKKIPTIQKLFSTINGDESLPNIEKRQLRTMLNNLNFKSMKQKVNCALLEKNNLILWRRKYLTSLRAFREEKRPVFYLGETWFYSNNDMIDQKLFSKKIKPSENLTSGSTSQTIEDKIFIIFHIGSFDGFVPGGLWCIETRKNSKDFQNGIKSQCFQKWFEEILPLLKNNAVIVLGHEKYQSEKSEKIPTIEWKKQDIVEWLSSKSEEIDPEKQVKVELLQIVNRIKSKFDTYVIDEIAKQNGKTVLRLPLYHSELNAIELVWPLLKQHIIASNATINIDLIHQSVESFNTNHWQSCISNLMKTEQKLWEMDFICDELLDQLESKPSDSPYGDNSTDPCDGDYDLLFKS